MRRRERQGRQKVGRLPTFVASSPTFVARHPTSRRLIPQEKNITARQKDELSVTHRLYPEEHFRET